MSSALREMFSDTSTVPLISLAVFTAGYAAYCANDSLFKQRDPTSRSDPLPLSSQLAEDNTHVLHGPAAFAFPVIAAISITLLFFFLRSIGIIFTALSTVSGLFSIVFVLWPYAVYISSRFQSNPNNNINNNPTPFTFILAFIPSLFIILTWLFTGHWLMNNIIGISLCILFASICRVPNLKVVAILFTGLFFYDIFFVFFSERVFGRNVMVEVATSEPTNPASAIASWFGLPFSPVKNLALPAKLIIPTSDGSQAILGLGDIILPEVLLTYLLDFDLRQHHHHHHHQSTFSLLHGLFIPSLIAYTFAIIVSFYCNYAFRAAQPALLYIVPAVLGTSAILASTRKQLSTLWNGLSTIPPTSPVSRDDDEHDEHHQHHHQQQQQQFHCNSNNHTSLLTAESYTLLNPKRNGDVIPTSQSLSHI